MAKLTTIRDEAIKAQINLNAVNGAGSAYWSKHYHEPAEGPEAAADARAVMQADPSVLVGIAQSLADQHTATMISDVAADLKGVYEEVSEVYAVGVADNFIGSKEYKTLKKAMANGTNVDQAFVALHRGKSMLANIVTLASQDAVLRGANNAVSRVRTREFKANNIVKTDGTVNRAGTARYDAAQVGALPTAEQKTYHQDVGFTYAREQDATHFK